LNRAVLAIFAIVLAAMPAMAATAPRNTHAVKPGPLKVELKLTGVFEAVSTSEVSLAPKAWPQMTVLWAVEPGAVVKKGDVLVRLETEDLARRIQDLEAARPLAEIALRQARGELRLLEEMTERLLDDARRDERRADEDLAYYVADAAAHIAEDVAWWREWHDIDRARIRADVDHYKSIYEPGEMDQPTEQLQLRFELLRNMHSKLWYERQTRFELPRREHVLAPRELKDNQDNVMVAGLARDRAEATLPLALERKQAEVDKLEHEREKAARLLDDLKTDREAMVVRAPAAGVVYYGRCERGRWTTGREVAGRLRRGGALAANEVFITVVQPGAMFVRADVVEKDIGGVRDGAAVRIVPTGYRGLEMAGRVRLATAVPSGPEPYCVEVALDDDAGPVLPGMTCDVRVLVVQKEQAVTVPAAAVFADETDDDGHIVYVLTDRGKSVRRPVSVGRAMNGQLEIIDGLAEGDVILLEKPGH